jgi:hypothetical protein
LSFFVALHLLVASLLGSLVKLAAIVIFGCINAMGYVYTDVGSHCKKTVQPDNFVRTDNNEKKNITLPFPDSHLRQTKIKVETSNHSKKRCDTEKPYE